MEARRKRKPKQVKVPLLDDMVEVTEKNRKRLEKQFGIFIPPEVTFIVPPPTLLTVGWWDKDFYGTHKPECSNPERFEKIEQELWEEDE